VAVDTPVVVGSEVDATVVVASLLPVAVEPSDAMVLVLVSSSELGVEVVVVAAVEVSRVEVGGSRMPLMMDPRSEVFPSMIVKTLVISPMTEVKASRLLAREGSEAAREAAGVLAHGSVLVETVVGSLADASFGH
jgi:hypothetical protein